MRNKITHGYDEIEPVNLWFTVKTHLPVLKRETQGLLEKGI